MAKAKAQCEFAGYARAGEECEEAGIVSLSIRDAFGEWNEWNFCEMHAHAAVDELVQLSELQQEPR